jgi:CelD/BcsL family acetyltransferase involved in cellulose biosynthesis
VQLLKVEFLKNERSDRENKKTISIESQEPFLLGEAFRERRGDRCRGFFDAAKVGQAGHRNVIALMGSSLSDVEAGLLQKHFCSAVLMPDDDAAGQAATEGITRWLSQVIDVEPIHLKPGAQPHQLAARAMNDTLSGNLREVGNVGAGIVHHSGVDEL